MLSNFYNIDTILTHEQYQIVNLLHLDQLLGDRILNTSHIFKSFLNWTPIIRHVTILESEYSHRPERTSYYPLLQAHNTLNVNELTFSVVRLLQSKPPHVMIDSCGRIPAEQANEVADCSNQQILAIKGTD